MSAFISPMLYSERSDFICVIHGYFLTSWMYSLKFLMSTWSANFLWSSLTSAYLRSRSDGSMLDFSSWYSSNWRLSLRSSHLSMAYSLYGSMPNSPGLYMTSAMLSSIRTSLSMLSDTDSTSQGLTGLEEPIILASCL